MSMWRIRITIPGDPLSLDVLTQALADQPASTVRLTARDSDPSAAAADVTGEVLVELAHDEGLAAMLSTLHGISPQVYVSRAEPDELARPAPVLVRRPGGPRALSRPGAGRRRGAGGRAGSWP